MLGCVCRAISVRFRTLRGIHRLAEELFVAEKGLYSMELFILRPLKEVL